MPFFTRPNFEDRQHVQYSGTSITLSGFTNINQTGQLIILGPILDFTGTTTASTSVTIADVTGYINNSNISGFKLEPPTLYLSGSTGSTIVDVTDYILTSFDSKGNVIWKQPIGTTSGDCISDFYVSNLHGCSPITVWDQFQHTTCSATGQSSNSFGNLTYSYGDYSNSEGYNNYAIGNYSHVEGNYPDRDENRAIGDGSHAEGTETTANGNASHVEGDGSTANGIASHAEGLLTTSDGGGSHSEGHTTNSVGIASHSEGQLTIANGGYSHAEGYQSSTYGLYSHAEGNGTKTYAPYSHSEGQLNISGLVYLYTEYISGATGYFYIDSIHGDVTSFFQNGDDLFISDINSNKNFLVSTYQYTVDGVSYQEISPSISGTVISVSPDPGFADDLGTNLFIGNLTIPLVSTISNSEIFDASHTEGSNNISFGLNSHAEGYYTISYGEASHSQGRTTKSIGDYSFASGLNTYADGNQTFIHSTNSHIKGSNFTSILGGNSNTIENNSTSSGIIGGTDNSIENSSRSVIIGGINNTINGLNNVVILGVNGLTASDDNTVYVPSLNIGNLGVGSPTINLGLDVNGNVVTGVMGGTGSTTVLFTGNTSATCITDLYVSNLNSCSPLSIQNISSGDVLIGENGGVNVGIGTNSPTQKLHVSGNTLLSNNVNGDLNVLVDNKQIGGINTRSSVAQRVVAESSGTDFLVGGMYLSGYETDLSGFGFSDNGTGYLKNTFTMTLAGSYTYGSINIGTRGAPSMLRFFSGNQDFDSTSLRGSLDSNGNWGFGTNMTGQTSTVDIKGTNGYNQLRLRTTYTPSSSGDTNGNIGDVAWDNNYLYIKTVSGWGRTVLDYSF